jgi:hypothetical protein
MSTGQTEAPRGRLQAPIVIALLVGAFAVGGLTGFSLPRAAGSSRVDAAARAAIPGVAVNSMSDAADRAFRGLASRAAIPGVAVNSMQNAFHLEKVCDTDTHCTVTVSSFDAIPVGTEINYSGPDPDHLVAAFDVKNGSATGQCAIGSIFRDPSLPGSCRFDTGTGRLSQFHLDVVVTLDGSAWHWDGTYWFGSGGARRP